MAYGLWGVDLLSALSLYVKFSPTLRLWREWDSTLVGAEAGAPAFSFLPLFSFWYHIAVLPSGNGGDLIYGKMVSRGSSPGNHGGGQRILSREHEVRLKDCAPVAATVLSGPNITW